MALDETIKTWNKAREFEPERKTKYDPGSLLEVEISEIRDFGAMANVVRDLDTGEYDGREFGLIHISEISDVYVDKVSKYLKKGEVHIAKVIPEDRGRLCLTLVHEYHGYKRGLSPKYKDITKEEETEQVKEEIISSIEKLTDVVKDIARKTEELESRIDELEIK